MSPFLLSNRTRNEETEEWGSDIISRLAYYTCEAELNPGDTMDIGPATPDGSTIAALLFFGYATSEVRGQQAGLLLCMGITDAELKACRKGKREMVEEKLKAAGLYPFTDLFRKSVV